MALSALSLSTTTGVQGFPFQATINGLTTGRVEVLNDGSPGFSTVNGKLMNQGLSYPVNTVVLREWEPGVGQGYRDTRIDISAVSHTAQRQKARALLGPGRSLVQSGVAINRDPDGNMSAEIYAQDDLGATRRLPTGDAARPHLPNTIIKPTSLTGITANSAAVLSFKAAPAPHPDGRTDFLAIKCLAADTFCGGRTFVIPANFKLADAYLVGMWVYWDAANGSVSLRFTSDGFASKNKTFSWSWSGQLHRGWNLLTVNPSGDATTNPGGTSWTVAGGFLDSDVVNAIEVQVGTNGAADTEIFVGEVFYHSAKPTRGTVCFGFDQIGQQNIVTYALPIFEKYGVKGYWAGDANLIQNPGNPRNYLQAVYDRGWDAINQGFLHPDYSANPSQLATDIVPSRQIFRDLFPRAAELFSYPLSANNAATDQILADAGVPMARSGWSWAVHPNEFNLGPKLIGHGAVNIGGKTLTQVKALVDYWDYYGLIGFPFAHDIIPGGDGTTPPADTQQWYANDLDALFAYILGKGMNMDSPTQLLAKRTLP